MNQTKLESTIEVIVNYITGFILSYLIYRYICMPLDLMREPMIITTIFTVFSIVRSFLWRRFFNAGLHKLVHKGVTRWWNLSRRSSKTSAL